MKELTVKVIGKEVSNDKGKFTAYALLTMSGRWYRTAKADPNELKKYDGEVVVVSVSRKFDKEIISNGEKKLFPTLVIESIRKPNQEELTAYEKALDEINSKTLADVE